MPADLVNEMLLIHLTVKELEAEEMEKLKRKQGN